MNSRPLLVLAHYGEAQAFLDHFHADKDRRMEGLFQSPEVQILLTGEGLFSASQKLCHALSLLQGQVSRVINLGIAGGLNQQVKLHQVYSVRTCFAWIGRPEFRSFQSENFLSARESLTCISSVDRVKDASRAAELGNFADLVDRELWAVASSCHYFKIPWLAWKLVSDLPLTTSDQETCEAIRRDEFSLSQGLLQQFLHWQSANSEGPSPRPEPKITAENLLRRLNSTDGHWTQSQTQSALKILQKLLLRDGDQETEHWLQEKWSELQSKNFARPKDRTTRLLKTLADHLYPLGSQYRQRLYELSELLAQRGLQLDWDPKLENQKLRLSFEFSNETGLRQKLAEIDPPLIGQAAEPLWRNSGV